ncbi:GntR family transcriptional regulator [Fodinicurvata sp. EGI_FJ10296]|uniref:GntR family transcriptional regulator n=1 Tax=Fodinicurvata sp. EGI_FJ10296 TaxID=3231908 RepID=UPI0034512FFF
MILVRDSLAEQIRIELRTRILSGRYALGERINVDLVASDLNVSQSPVKEALKQLEREGLVEIRPRSGTIVRRFTRQELTDIYGTRRIIEPAASGLAVTQGAVTPDLLARLEQTMDALADASSGPQFMHPLEVTEADSTFHRLIVDSVGNAILTVMHSSLIDRAHLVRNFASRGPRARETLAEHRRIIDALRAGDAQEAHDATLDHLKSAEFDINRSMEAPPP